MNYIFGNILLEIGNENLIKNNKKYKSGNNRQMYCDTCSGDDRSMGGSCTNLNYYVDNRLSHGL